MSTTVAVVPSIVSSPVDLVAASDGGGVDPGEHLLDPVAELRRVGRHPVAVEVGGRTALPRWSLVPW
jgi:hypothetical protein